MEPETIRRERRKRRPTVQRVARQRIAGAREMHADLVAIAGPRRDRYQREAAETCNRFHDRQRGARAMRGRRFPFVERDHLAMVSRMMRDWRVQPEREREFAGDDRLVAASNQPALNRLAELAEGAGFARDDEG